MSSHRAASSMVPSPIPRSTEATPTTSTPLLNPGEGGVPEMSIMDPSAPFVSPYSNVGGRYLPFGVGTTTVHSPIRPPPGFPERIPRTTDRSDSSVVVPSPRAKKIPLITDKMGNPIDVSNPDELRKLRRSGPMPIPLCSDPGVLSSERPPPGYPDHGTMANHGSSFSVLTPPPRAKKVAIIYDKDGNPIDFTRTRGGASP